MFLDDINAKWPPIRSYADLYNRLPIGNPYYFVFWLISFLFFLYAVKSVVIRRDSPRIQFFITDIWTGILALMPAFVVLLDATSDSAEIDWRLIGLFVVTFGSICGGIWLWLVLAMPKPEEPRPDRWSHFVSVLGGGFVGLLGVFVSGVAFAILPYFIQMIRFLPTLIYHITWAWFATCMAMPPLFVATALAIWFSKKAFDTFY